jgi:hypothetical protein
MGFVEERQRWEQKVVALDAELGGVRAAAASAAQEAEEVRDG